MLTTKEANEARPEYVKKFFEFAQTIFDDVGMTSSNSFNFPILYGDKEGFVQVTVKIPTKAEDDDCYSMREEYQLNLQKNARKAAEAEEKKQKKKEADEKRRAEAKAKRERLQAEKESVKA